MAAGRVIIVIAVLLLSGCKDERVPQVQAADTARVTADSASRATVIDTLTAVIFAPLPSTDPYAIAAATEFKNNLSEITDSLRTLGFEVMVATDSLAYDALGDKGTFRPCGVWQGCAAIYFIEPSQPYSTGWSGPFTTTDVLTAARGYPIDTDKPDPFGWGAWDSGTGIRFIPPGAGGFTRDDFDKSIPGEWVAFRTVDSTATITRVTLAVDSVEMECPDYDGLLAADSGLFGRTLRLTPNIDFDALISGPSAISEGVIAAAVRIGVDTVPDAERTEFENLPRRIRYLYRGEPVELVRMPYDFIELRYRGKRYPILRWRGFDEGRWNLENDRIADLNGDGMLDVVLDISPKYTVEHWFWFFLSDPLHPELGPRIVDRFPQYGCGHL